jgi:serine/threonine protein kinase
VIGSKLGDYEILRLIGKGGMGAVYEALKPSINRRVAIKLLLPEYAEREDVVRRFINEARAVNAVNHPGVVRIFDFGDLPDKTVYILMEFLDGETLFSRLAAIREGRASRMSLLQAARFTQQVASIMSRAHEKGVVHRDIKPDNIILVKDPGMPGGERLKLLDFGLAKFLDSAERRTTAGMAIGLDTIDGKSDVYAAGCMLFEMISGAPPFTGEIGQIMRQHVFTPPPILSDRAAGVPNEVVALVGQMLNKNPQLRPDMKQLESRIEQLMDRGVLSSKSEGPNKPPSDATAATMAMPLAKRPGVQLTEKVGAVIGIPQRLRQMGVLLAVCGVLAGFGGGVVVGALRPRPCPQVACPPPAPPPEAVKDASSDGKGDKDKAAPGDGKTGEPGGEATDPVDTAKPKKGAAAPKNPAGPKGKKPKKASAPGKDPGSVF